VTDSELLDRIRQLRGQGCSPKEIARALEIRPSVVSPLVRQVGAEQAANASEPALAGCWVNQGGARSSASLATPNGRADLPLAGPNDDTGWVMRTLTRSVGEGNFDFLVGLPV
jgi:hypothetical protein